VIALLIGRCRRMHPRSRIGPSGTECSRRWRRDADRGAMPAGMNGWVFVTGQRRDSVARHLSWRCGMCLTEGMKYNPTPSAAFAGP
jgi:hypothetical protein